MAATQWPQNYQQYQQQLQHYQQSQQYAQGQQYQQPQQYQQNQRYQSQQYQQSQQTQPTQQYQTPQKSQPTQQVQQHPQSYPVQQYPREQQYQAHQHQQHQQHQQPHPGQPTQQYSQPQQTQPAQQHPQQQPHQPQQGHNGYQYQYALQQYPSQQYAPQQQGYLSQHGSPPVHSSPQQYGTSQFGAYQQASQPQRNPAHGQSPAQSAPQPCFNCGKSGHFAMDCPEPIRDVPAGKVNPQAFQNPLRRPKTIGAVAAQQQYTPNPSHAQVSPTGYPPQPHGQTGYPQQPQHQQAYSPPTPLSAQSPAQAQYYQQWQQYYQSQQAFHQGNHNHQGSPYHQQPYTAPQGQITGKGIQDGSQTPSQPSVQASQYTGAAQMYQSQFTPASATPIQIDHQSFSDRATSQHGQRTQSLASMKSQSTSSSPRKAQLVDYNFEEDDLDSLDVPDLPQTTLDFANTSQQPVNLIGHPLPGNFIVADALAPFPEPGPHDEGYCRSKYQYDASLEGCLENIKYSKYWEKEHADDVAFSGPPANGKVIPVDEILLTIRQRHTHPELSDEFKRDSRSQSRTVSMSQDSLEVKITLDRMERELAETKAKLQAKLDKGRAASSMHLSPLQPMKSEYPPLQGREIKDEYQTPPQSATLEKPIKSEHDAEDVLAHLGVTGAPKPVTATTWPDQNTGLGSSCGRHMSRSRSSSRADNLGVDQHRVQSSLDQVAPEHQANGTFSHSQHFGPPPPPPMPFRQQSCPDRTDGSPLSAGLSSIDPFGNNTNGVDHSNGNGDGSGFLSPPTDGQAPSPIELRSEKSHSRKRQRDSSSDGEENPKRRQEDDYTPKLKKRQPKVAEAYSRRW